MKYRPFENPDLNRLPFYPETIGYRFSQNSIDRSSGMPFHQIFVVCNGEAQLSLGSSSCILQENDMFFIRANTPHAYAAYKNSDFKTAFLGFDGSGAEGLFSFLGVQDHGIYLGKNAGNVLSLLGEYYSCFERINDPFAAGVKTHSIVHAFFDACLKNEESPTERVYRYILENYNTPLSLEDFCRVYRSGKTKLYAAFKANYGMTPHEKLLQTRLEHARFLLENDFHLTVKEVAARCGFNDESYFCKMYKRRYGETPKKRP